MPKNSVPFVPGDRVFAKVRGYPAWPARVEQVLDAKATKYQVFFYGTYESATVKKDEMWRFDENTKARFGKEKMKGNKD